MTWLIVVGAIVVVALAVHFGEERKSRAKRARKAPTPSAGRISYARSVTEKWELDLEAMVAVVTRSDDRGAIEATLHFRVIKQVDGSFSLDPSAPIPWPLPAALTELLKDAQRPAR